MPFFRVKHNPSVHSSVDAVSDAPFGVFQLRTVHKELLDAESDEFFAIRGVKIASESFERWLWRVCLAPSDKGNHIRCGVLNLSGRNAGLFGDNSLLEVLLTVHGGGVDVTDVIWAAGGQNN